MAHTPFTTEQMRQYINIDLSANDFADVSKKIGGVLMGLPERVDKFTCLVAKKGSEWCKSQFPFTGYGDFDAVESGDLKDSIYEDKLSSSGYSSTWQISTHDIKYAQYVEYGTGPVATKAETGIHPSGMGKYRPTPWIWNGKPYSGRPSIPYMYNTWEHLQSSDIISDAAEGFF